MGKAQTFINEVTGDGKDGYIKSLRGWQKIMEESSNRLHDALDGVERALKSEDLKQIEKSVGSLHHTIEELQKNAGVVKLLTNTLRGEVKDPAFWNKS